MDDLLKGPNVLNPIRAVLLRFRRGVQYNHRGMDSLDLADQTAPPKRNVSTEKVGIRQSHDLIKSCCPAMAAPVSSAH